MIDFYVDGRTGRVHRAPQYHEDPETVRLRRKAAAKAKAKRDAAKRARRRNRR